MNRLPTILVSLCFLSSCGIFGGGRGGHSGVVMADGTAVPRLPRDPKGWVECPMQTDGGSTTKPTGPCADVPGAPAKTCLIYRAKPGGKWEEDPAPTPFLENVPDSYGWYHRRYCK